MPEAEPERYRAPALDKGLDILELLSGIEEGLSQIEIAKALDRTPNEIYRMLDRLVRRGYVLKNAADRYSLTLKLFGLAHQHAPARRLMDQALPPMRRFAREAWQACHLAIYDRGQLIVVAQADAPGSFGLAVRMGTHLGLLDSASGQVLLANTTPEHRILMLEECRPQPDEAALADPDLERQLTEVRVAGFAMSVSPETQAVTKLSVPVFGPDRRLLGALTCPWIERQDNPGAPDREATIDLLRRAADAIGNGRPDF